MKPTLLFFALSLTTMLGFLDAENINPKQKQPILVIPGEVTIDGISRPDLGRSFCDSITGKLLKSGKFTIADQVSTNSQGVANKEGSTGEIINPEKIVKQLAGKTTAHYALIPRMISEDDFSKFSIKKLRVADSEVVSVYQASAVSTKRATMFDLLDEATNHLLREVYAEQSRIRRQNRPSIIDLEKPRTEKTSATKRNPDDEGKNRKPTTTVAANTPPGSQKEKSQEQPPASVDRKVEGDEAEKTQKTAQYVGRICAVDAKWHFCVIELDKNHSLQVDDLVLVRTDNPAKSISRLNVSRIEGNKVIADCQENDISSLRLDLKVYRWGVAKKG
ncbi:MAG: hypothetical protein GY899_02345 [Verrucomicrobiaceae bacterium]|nr:hypothetical protein [Verrucomicrobiaceae bacterium]